MSPYGFSGVLLSLCTLLFPFLCAYGQSEATRGDTLLHRADSLLSIHHISEASELYHRVLAGNDTSGCALIGLGNAAMVERSWSNAIDWYEQSAKADTGSLEARYHLGRAYAERGRARYIIEKILGLIAASSFDKARQHLQWVLQRDSLYRDVLYQLALVSYFEREYREAIPFALKQLQVKPGLRNGHTGVQKIYREAIVVWSGSADVERLPQPEHEYDRFFHAERIRQNGRLEEAEQELRLLFAQPGMLPQPLLLQSLARIKAGQKKPDEIEEIVTSCIDSICSMADADLVFEDIKYLMTDQELSEYEAVQTPSEARQYFRMFWTRRNPYPASRSNARIAQHYERLIYAEKNFQQFGRKTFAVETMPVDFPRAYFLNEELNDKGIIYLRHGEPDRTIVTFRGSDGGPSESNESWQYFATPDTKEMLFDFYIPMGAHITEWRLTPVLPDPAMWEDRAEYSHKYLRLAHSASSGVSQLLLESTDEGKREIEAGITKDRFKYSDTLRYYESPVSIACFRGSGGRTAIDIGYVIDQTSITAALPDSVNPIVIDAEYSVYTRSWQRVATSQRTRRYSRSTTPGNVSIELFRTLVAPDSYYVAWQAKPVKAPMMFNKEVRILAPDFTGASLMLSDIQLAYTIDRGNAISGFDKRGLSVVPNPLAKAPLDRPLYLYFEVYNLARNQQGQASYRIDYKLTSVNIEKSFLARLFGGEKRTSVSVPSERTGRGNWAQEYIAIDVSELEPGNYSVQVALRDNNSGASISRSVSVDLYEKKR